jgi:hypothetical protein
MRNPQLITWFGPRGGTFQIPIAAPVILWDKDSTLAHCAHRQPVIDKIRAGEASWVEYSQACAGDGVFPGQAVMFRTLAGHVRQFIVSGANCEAEPEIRSWARRHFIPYDAMALRAPGNHQPNAKFKITVVREMRAMMMNPLLLVEDWPDCSAQVREATGLPVMTVNPCYEVDLRDGAGA